MKKGFISLIFILSIGFFTVPSVQSSESYGTVGITGYGAGTTLHSLSSAMSTVVSRHTDFSMRVEPGDSDLARILPLKEGKTEFGFWTMATGVMTSRGMGEVGKKIGPQPIQLAWLGGVVWNNSPWVAKDSDIYKLEDLKGKRVPIVIGVDAHNYGLKALLAFARLTMDDVKKVEISGYVNHYDALLEDRTDIAFGAPTSASAQKLHSSPRGIRHINLDPDDQEAWERAWEIAPWFDSLYGEEGAGVSKENPVQGLGYPDTLYVYPHVEKDLVYQVVKTLHEYHDELSGMHNLLKRFTIDEALSLERLNRYKIPYHEGAIEYFKEIGKWTPEHEKFQKAALKFTKGLQDR